MKAEDKDRKRAWKAEQKAVARAAFPLSHLECNAMFDFIEDKLTSKECDHTRRFTTTSLDERQVDAAAVLAWLDSTGGFCDCEVVANSRDHWEMNRE
jgi:hypothetical protein